MKGKVKSDADAIKLSSLMRENLHNVMTLLSLIKSAGGNEILLSYLKPDYAYQDFKFGAINRITGEVSVTRIKISNKNVQKNADRYIRISLDSLEDYHQKKNRNHRNLLSKKVDAAILKMIKLSNSGEVDKARELLEEEIKKASVALLTY